MDSILLKVPWDFWVFGAAAVAFFALRILFPESRKKRVNLPPSPGVIPIIGSFPFIAAKPGEPAYKTFSRLSAKFGPITYLQMGSSPTIIVSSGDIANEILKDHDLLFASRPYTSAGKYLAINFHATTFAPSGPYFKRIRKIYKGIFAPKRLSGTQALREKAVHVTLGAIYQRAKEGEHVINLTSVFKDVALISMMTMLFGWRSGNKMVKSFGTIELADLKDLFREVVQAAAEFNVGDFVTIARWLDLQGVIGRMKNLNKRMKATAAVLIGEYERSGKKSPGSPDATIFDMLLSLEGDNKLDSESITGVLYDLLLAGSDTSGQSIDWTIAELLRQPQLVQTLQSELNTVIGKDRFVTEADIPNLPFLQAIVKESLRLHPPAPLGLPHFSTADCKIAGYDIPAGTTTLLNIVDINRDPKHWPEPHKFSPNRFFMQERENDVSPFGSAYHFLPFSSGRRQCPGMHMGLPIVQLAVANFVHAFEYQAAGGLTNEEIDVVNEAASFVSTRAHDLIVTATPRLNSQVYEKFCH